MSALPTVSPEPEEDKRQLEAYAGRRMRSRARDTWLIPLVAVPLGELALSALYSDEVVRGLTGHDPVRVKQDARRLEAIFGNDEGRENGELSDAEALLLVEFTYELRALLQGVLHPAPILLGGIGIPDDMRGDPLIRRLAAWIPAAPLPLPLTALLTCHMLSVTVTQDRDFVPPTQHARYGACHRAMAGRVADAGIKTWHAALTAARDYWKSSGWLDLCRWQQEAMNHYVAESATREDAARAAEQERRDREVRRHRDERKRLRAAATASQDELRKLRSAGKEAELARKEVQKLKLREAELTQARDRAQEQVARLEASVRTLEQANKELRYRLAPYLPSPMPPPVQPAPTQPQVPEETIPADLLKGRQVFYFTGQVRKADAESAAESLRPLGPRDIRTYCVQKGSLGPETFPAKALVVLDVRFMAHKHSIAIEGRARRSGVEYLRVNSGKGGLARAVVAGLDGSG